MRHLFLSPLARAAALPALALLLSWNYQASAASDPWEALPQWQFGHTREPLATIEAEIRKSDAEARAEIEGRLLEILPSPTTTKDSKRFICRWLGTVGSEKSVPPLAVLLTDPDLAHPARIALERLPYPSAGQALVRALSEVHGKLLVGVISSLGAKRVEEAVPGLARLLDQNDPELAKAVLAALGQIGNEPANHVLASAKTSVGLERARARAQITAAGRLADSGKSSLAAAAFQRLLDDSQQPDSIRVAAFLGLAGTLPKDQAVALLVNALQSDESLMRSAAVKAIAQAGQARNAVALKLPSLQAKAQLLLLGILADAPEVAARKPLLEVARSASDSAVKAAAMECLGVHGEAEDVPFIAQIAAAGPEAASAAAARTLQRISANGVDAVLLRLVESGDAGQRKAVMEALPSRRMESALPTLNRLMKEADAAIAADAAKALGQMGGTAQIKDLAQVMTATENNDLRGAAQEAIKTICTRVEDKAACGEIIQSELADAQQPEARAALLPLTLYAGGERALREVLKAMRDQNDDVRATAFRTLVSWPEARAAEPLLRFAETNSGSQAIVALRDGCLRLAELEEVPAEQRAAILLRVTQLARRSEEKQRAVSLMGQVPSLELLQSLPALAADQTLRAPAISSTIELARSLGPVYPRQSMAALNEARTHANTDELRQALETGIKAVRNAGQSREGYILGWMISGPYTAPDKDGAALFDVPFAPEKHGAQVDWRPFGAPSNGMIDLGSLMPGENRVAYLCANIASEQDQKAVLEMGSDDGLKVWLNGQAVLANNAVRPCSPGQDKVTVNLRKGDNVLLLKVTQGGGQYAAIARVVGTDGKPLSNVTVAAATN